MILWQERNRWYFDGIQCSDQALKESLICTLFQWACQHIQDGYASFLDFIDWLSVLVREYFLCLLEVFFFFVWHLLYTSHALMVHPLFFDWCLLYICIYILVCLLKNRFAIWIIRRFSISWIYHLQIRCDFSERVCSIVLVDLFFRLNVMFSVSAAAMLVHFPLSLSYCWHSGPHHFSFDRAWWTSLSFQNFLILCITFWMYTHHFKWKWRMEKKILSKDENCVKYRIL